MSPTGSGVVFVDDLQSTPTPAVVDPPPPPPPTPRCDCGITDSFEREVSTNLQGWGTGDSGFRWNPVYAASSTNTTVGVTGGSAYVQFANFFGDYDSTVADCITEVIALSAPHTGLMEFEVDRLPASVSGSLTCLTQRVQIEIGYYGQVDINYLTETVTLPGGATVAMTGWSANSSTYVKWNWDGTTISTKVWQGTEPGSWQGTDAGSAFDGPLEIYTKARYQDVDPPGPPTTTFRYHSIDISGINRCTEYRFDNFSRTVSNGWGTSDVDLPWTTAGSTSVWSVNGSRASLTGSGLGWNMIQAGAGPWLEDEVTFTALFRTGNLSTGSGEWDIRFTGFNGGSHRDCFIGFFNGTGASFVEIDNGAGAAGASVTFLSNTWYFLKLFHSQLTGELSATVWKQGDTEPSSPTATKTLGATTPSGALDFRFICRSYSGTFSLLWEYIDFDYEGKPCYVDEEGNPVMPGGTGGGGTGGGGGGFSGSSPSGEDMPTSDPAGWTRVLEDDFNVTIAEGRFGADNSSTWSAYPSTWHDTTGNGWYTPDIISQHDGVLDIYMREIGGLWRVGAPTPRAAGYTTPRTKLRISARMRADQVAGFKTAWLLWPDSEVWPRDGEIDFPEGNLNSIIEGFMHRQDATVGNDQDYATSGQTYQNWHTVTIEWVAGVSCKFIFDGTTIGSWTSRVPNTPMHYVMQCETRLSGGPPPTGAAAHVYVDWVVVWTQ